MQYHSSVPCAKYGRRVCAPHFGVEPPQHDRVLIDQRRERQVVLPVHGAVGREVPLAVTQLRRQDRAGTSRVKTRVKNMPILVAGTAKIRYTEKKHPVRRCPDEPPRAYPRCCSPLRCCSGCAGCGGGREPVTVTIWHVYGGETYLNPQGSATREQVATILMEFLQERKEVTR